MLVDAWLPRAAALHPERPAVNAVTYAELLARADALARRLAARGIGPGDRVAIALDPGEAFCEALHACLRLGAAAVPVDLRLAAAERERIVAGAFVLDGPLEGAEADVVLRDAIDLDAVAVVVHTSGTTSAPRAIELTAGNWLWSALGSAVALGLDPRERWLCALPLAHVGGLAIVLRSAICATTAVVHPRFDVERVLAALDAPEGATVVSLVPTTLARLLDAGLCEPPALRWALLGGAAIAPALLERAADAGVPVATTYGLTEACSQVVTRGAPLFCTRVRLDDASGEIVVRGPTVAPASGPELRTGDLGAWGDDGELQVVGRISDTIVSGGENVAPAEVEAVLLEHPAVVEVAVHGRPDAAWGEAVVATVVARDGDPGERLAEELRAWCAERLAGFKVPKQVGFAASLPRHAVGQAAAAGAAMIARVDPEAYRAFARERWEAAADGWSRERESLSRAGAPVTGWLLDAVAPQPGATLLEVACGNGDVGLEAARLVGPEGRVIVTDGAEAMVALARAQADALGLINVEARAMEAEWLDLPTATVDAVVSRYGYMLLVDPEAGLREARRVLRPGGRIALAVWDVAEANPWATLADATEAAFSDARSEDASGGDPDAHEPGRFALAGRGRLAALLADAGFAEIRVESIDVAWEVDDLDAWWQHTLRTSPRMTALARTLSPARHYALRDAFDAAFAPYVDAAGAVSVPGRALAAVGEA